MYALLTIQAPSYALRDMIWIPEVSFVKILMCQIT